MLALVEHVYWSDMILKLKHIVSMIEFIVFRSQIFVSCNYHVTRRSWWSKACWLILDWNSSLIENPSAVEHHIANH